MIVNCPNCSLEQSLDQYCAGCGKQLEKLLNENKLHLASRKRKTNYFIVFVTLTFISSFYFYYSITQSSDKNFAQEPENSIEKKVQVSLPKAKIKRSKKIDIVAKKINTKESLVKFESFSADKPKVVKSNLKLASASTKEIFKEKKLKTLYFISLERCSSDNPESGSLNQDELNSILDCANTLFRIREQDITTVIDESASFSSKASMKQNKTRISVNLSLSTPAFTHSFEKLLSIDLNNSKAAAEIWKYSKGKGLGDHSPNDEMLSSYATSAIYGLSLPDEPPIKAYFLATFN